MSITTRSTKASAPDFRRNSRPAVNTVQRSRLCIFESEKGVIFVSASVVATIIARIDGDAAIVVEQGIPVFWIGEKAMIQVLGEPSWDAVVKRLGYILLSITFDDWTEQRLLDEIRAVFPTAELQNLNAIG